MLKSIRANLPHGEQVVVPLKNTDGLEIWAIIANGLLNPFVCEDFTIIQLNSSEPGKLWYPSYESLQGNCNSLVSGNLVPLFQTMHQFSPPLERGRVGCSSNFEFRLSHGDMGDYMITHIAFVGRPAVLTDLHLPDMVSRRFVLDDMAKSCQLDSTKRGVALPSPIDSKIGGTSSRSTSPLRILIFIRK